ncbi:hypothetical protein Plhal710r2_c024g0097291 [Plasmopara halstedii]
MHSRARFARYFMEQVVEFVVETSEVELCRLLDDACAYISMRSHEEKALLNLKQGKYAQLLAISHSNAVACGEPLRKKPRLKAEASGMQLHFANLIDDEDVLLFLAVLGGKAFPCYYDYKGNKHYSIKCIFAKTKVFSVHENSNAVFSNDYKSFENMIARAIFTSSRRNGVQGIPLNVFFENLLGEIQDELWKKVAMHCRYTNKSMSASDLFEGYAEDVRNVFGHLVRASNAERCDDYVQDVESEHIVLLFCMELASYCKEWEDPDIGCVKLSYQDGGVDCIFLFNRNNRKRLLLVVETCNNW